MSGIDEYLPKNELQLVINYCNPPKIIHIYPHICYDVL